MSRKLIVGCGYLGQRVARLWLAQGHQVAATTRRPETAQEWIQRGIEPIVWDVTDPQVPMLPEASTILFAVGYDRKATASIQQVYVDGLARLLRHLPPSDAKFVYVSSTGVYGHTAGDWLHEQSECQPSREGGVACLAAEHCLLSSDWGGRAVILRLAGIYGPGRVPQREKLVRGEPLPVAADGFLNLIHVEDAARAVIAASQLNDTPNIFNVSDGNPVKRRDYYEYFARIADLPPPVFAEPEDSGPPTRAGGSKRIDNSKMLRDLSFTLHYPNFRAGLDAAEAAPARDG